MNRPTAYTYSELLAQKGIAIGELGCVMLDVEPIPIEDIVPPGLEDQLFFTDHPEFWWVQGAVGANGAHVTLKYGFTEHGTEQKEAIDTLLEGVDLGSVKISHVGIFPSPKPEELPYACLVGHLQLDEDSPLVEANRRLSFLPHIDTFADYKAHVTLAYVQHEHRIEWRRRLHRAFAGRELAAVGLNYGSRK